MIRERGLKSVPRADGLSAPAQPLFVPKGKKTRSVVGAQKSLTADEGSRLIIFSGRNALQIVARDAKKNNHGRPLSAEHRRRRPLPATVRRRRRPRCRPGGVGRN
jgi:hypothetical protein